MRTSDNEATPTTKLNSAPYAPRARPHPDARRSSGGVRTGRLALILALALALLALIAAVSAASTAARRRSSHHELKWLSRLAC